MAEQNNKSSIIDINDIKAVGRIIAKNWFIVPIFLAISYAVSVFYTYRLTTVYSVQTQILLKSMDQYSPTSIITDNSIGYSRGGTYQTYMDNSNEMRVIRSYDLVEKAIRKMKLDVSYYIQGRVRVTEVYEGNPFSVNVLKINPAFYEKDFKFKILNENKFEVSYEKGEKQISKQYFFDKEIIEPDFRLLIRKKSEINKKTIKTLGAINYFFKVHSLSTLVTKCMSSLKVQNPDYTNIMQISFEDEIVERAKQFLDTLSKVYIQNTLEQTLTINKNTLFYIDKQMEDVVSSLNVIQDTLQRYKKDEGILNLNREEEEFFKKLSLYDEQKTVWILKLKALDALEDYIIQDKDPGFLPPSIYINSDDEFLQKNASDLYNMQTTRNQMLISSTESSPIVIELDEKIERTKKDILVYISNSRIAANSRIADVDEELNKYIYSIKAIPAKHRGLLDIERQSKVNENLYVFLLQKRASTLIAQASIIALTKVIETARFVGVAKPNKERITLFFMGGGLIISLLLIFIRIVFYEKVESIEELKLKTDLPIVGEILLNKLLKELTIPVETDPRSPITESFRTIRTNMQYMAPGSSSKIVVVTSNSPGEGKTFCSINLAAILAKAGKKVLLLEMDLHKPRIQKALNMTSEKGLSTILINKDAIEDCIVKTQIENLSVILSGPLPPNASELVMSDRLKDIFAFGKNNYDFVVVDTPPAGLISDSVVMMRMADVSLFVINTKFAHRDAILNAHEIVAQNKLTHFAFILNGVKRKKSKYYYNRYAYGYGYGYGKGYGYGGYGSYGGGYGDKS